MKRHVLGGWAGAVITVGAMTTWACTSPTDATGETDSPEVRSCAAGAMGTEVASPWPAYFVADRKSGIRGGEIYEIYVHPYCGNDEHGAAIPWCGEVFLAPKKCDDPQTRGCNLEPLIRAEPAGYRAPAVRFGGSEAKGDRTLEIQAMQLDASGQPVFEKATYELRYDRATFLLRRKGEACWTKMIPRPPSYD